MVLRRLVNSAVVGGLAGYNLSSHVARNEWRQRDIYDDPHFHRRMNGAWGQPQQSWYHFYGAPSVGDWPLTLQDFDLWDAMGRNHTRSRGVMGGALGAAAGAAVGLATRRRPSPPRRTPSPERFAL